ncbi:SPASM domain-containing protein [Thermodesulfobacteriota bacterium]
MEMSFDTFQTCLSKIPADVSIHFLGMSEPWLNPACTQMLLLAQERGHRMSVSTSLCGMSLFDIERFKSIPFEAFILHLPSDDRAMTIDIDEKYLTRLKRICESNISNLKVKLFAAPHPKIASIIKHVEEIKWPTMNRANNLLAQQITRTKKVKGNIKCHRIRNNVLLPNGDVALCCNDYGLQHIIGNLLTGTYDDLHKSEEFRRVRVGMADDNPEILCRYCSEKCMKIS